MNHLSTLTVASALIALSAAAPAMALDEITFGTNWVTEPEHGGFYQAVVDGTYEKYGLKVTIIPKAEEAMLLGGKLDFYMVGNLLQTFSAVEQSVPVKVVAAMFQKDPQIIMAHPEMGITKFEDLAKLESLFLADDLYISGYRWMSATWPVFTDEKRKPYNYSVAPFLADPKSGQQGYVTSEPYSVKTQGGFEPTVFLLADAGYSTPSTMIEGLAEYVDANPDITKRFVEASIIGWYNYLYGDNTAGNALIKTDNPEMSDEAIAYGIAKMKEYGIAVSGDAETKGIGCMTDERWQSHYDRMVEIGLFTAGIDIKQAYTTELVCQGLGMDLVK
jgi:NitT/TauT family transport system substrate-binding protein